VARINTEVHGNLDRLVELGLGPFLDQLDSFIKRIELVAVNAFGRFQPFTLVAIVRLPSPSGPSSGQNRQ
jgi:hypothetical protein